MIGVFKISKSELTKKKEMKKVIIIIAFVGLLTTLSITLAVIFLNSQYYEGDGKDSNDDDNSADASDSDGGGGWGCVIFKQSFSSYKLNKKYDIKLIQIQYQVF